MIGGCRFPEHHRDGGRGGGRALAAAVVVVIAAVAARTAVRAAVDVLTVAAAVLGVVAGLAVLGGLAVAVVRVRRRVRRRGLAYSVAVGRPVAGELPARGPAAALPGVRADVSPQARGYADARVVTGRNSRQRCPRRAGRWS